MDIRKSCVFFRGSWPTFQHSKHPTRIVQWNLNCLCGVDSQTAQTATEILKIIDARLWWMTPDHEPHLETFELGLVNVTTPEKSKLTGISAVEDLMYSKEIYHIHHG